MDAFGERGVTHGGADSASAVVVLGDDDAAGCADGMAQRCGVDGFDRVPVDDPSKSTVQGSRIDDVATMAMR